MEIRENILSYVPGTSQRVPDHTFSRINNRIHRKTLKRLDDIGHDPIKIDLRLWEIEREWDVERALEAHVAIVTMAGITLGATVNRKWYALPALVSVFFLQHAIQGWCPPLPIFRLLGFRTQREIDNERIVLLARRGWLDDLRKQPTAAALRALEE